MSFVRKKIINGKEYYYLVESRREGDKVHQKVLLYLGEYESVEAALERLPKDIDRHRTRAEKYREYADEEWRKSRTKDWLDLAGWQENIANRLERRLEKIRGFV